MYADLPMCEPNECIKVWKSWQNQKIRGSALRISAPAELWGIKQVESVCIPLAQMSSPEWHLKASSSPKEFDEGGLKHTFHHLGARNGWVGCAAWLIWKKGNEAHVSRACECHTGEMRAHPTAFVTLGWASDDNPVWFLASWLWSIIPNDVQNFVGISGAYPLYLLINFFQVLGEEKRIGEKMLQTDPMEPMEGDWNRVQ